MLQKYAAFDPTLQGLEMIPDIAALSCLQRNPRLCSTYKHGIVARPNIAKMTNV